MLEQDLESKLKSGNIINFNVTWENKRKGRICGFGNLFLDNREVFIKYNNNANLFFYNSLESEMEVYKNLKEKDYLPRYIIAEDGFLVTERIIGDSLRNYIQNCSNRHAVESIILKTFECYFEFSSDINNTVPKEYVGKENVVDQFDKCVYQLLYSGPSDTKISKICLYKNKIIHLLYANEINSVRRESRKSDLKMIHGDFHLNNVYVSGDKIKLLDFEDVQYGSAEMELAKYYVMVYKTLQHFNTDQLFKKVDLMIANAPIFFNTYNRYKNLFMKLVKYNPRYEIKNRNE